ncbi:uncharacterized protein VTP21DRAFT_5881 [Calcarisporiella thermophila]|uniref:uncharacterized protein n=1 Tax=Calcarisporiella thermophila TaxID=911321 RepID=UPI0037446673
MTRRAAAAGRRLQAGQKTEPSPPATPSAGLWGNKVCDHSTPVLVESHKEANHVSSSGDRALSRHMARVTVRFHEKVVALAEPQRPLPPADCRAGWGRAGQITGLDGTGQGATESLAA